MTTVNKLIDDLTKVRDEGGGESPVIAGALITLNADADDKSMDWVQFGRLRVCVKEKFILLEGEEL